MMVAPMLVPPHLAHSEISLSLSPAHSHLSEIGLRSVQCFLESLQQYTYLSLPVVLGPVTVPTELGKVLTVVECHLGFGGVLDLCQDVLLAVWFLGLVAQIVDPDPVALGPQLVERGVVDFEPLVAAAVG
uniref:(northern house mosquito) hypothetical protein n=1 Tax=Culex pipiens TaxID=7175 RepID=A0A8D8INL9_CULPI